MRRIGIDVGGTNTDAVIIENGIVLKAVKTPTSKDITGGVTEALSRLRTEPAAQDDVDGVMIGTTHFVNAVVQRRQLTPVGALRIGEPVSATLPPFCDWPADLAEIVRGGVWSVAGGHEYDGREIMPFDEEAVLRASQTMCERGLDAVSISGIFSPLDPSHEQRAGEIMAKEMPEASITLSSDLGRIGLLERENAALLNATLSVLAQQTIDAFESAVRDSGLNAPLFITQNDGTVAEGVEGLHLGARRRRAAAAQNLADVVKG